jgi:hypothetical protein
MVNLSAKLNQQAKTWESARAGSGVRKRRFPSKWEQGENPGMIRDAPFRISHEGMAR